MLFKLKEGDPDAASPDGLDVEAVTVSDLDVDVDVGVDVAVAIADAASLEADAGCCKLSITFLLASALLRLIGLTPLRPRSGLSSRALKVARI